ncbi:putative membrane protein YeiB [Micrococcus sp. 140720015-1]
MSTPTTTAAPGPARTLAPDLARGVMLLLIALANVAYWLPLRGMPVGTHSEPETTVDAVAQAVMLMAVDQRALPMFALLFGYSMVQFGRSQQARGLPWEAFRATLDRRHLGLALLGLAHTVLLWSGDILGGYAVLGFVLTYAFYRRTDRTVRLWRNALAWVMAGVAGLVALFTPLVMWALAMERKTLTGEGLDLDALIRESAQEIGRASDASWLVDLPERLAVWLGASITTPLVLTVTVPMLTGLLWARRGLLDRPAEHRRESSPASPSSASPRPGSAVSRWRSRRWGCGPTPSRRSSRRACTSPPACSAASAMRPCSDWWLHGWRGARVPCPPRRERCPRWDACP